VRTCHQCLPAVYIFAAPLAVPFSVLILSLQKRASKQMEILRSEQSRLPVNSFKAEIVTAVQCNPVIVVAGDTGCGKVGLLYLFQSTSHALCTK